MDKTTSNIDISNTVTTPKGDKGKGGGSYRAAVEDPNTLQSRSIASLVDVLCEGEILGLEGYQENMPGKGIYFNDTPLVTKEGVTTYPNVAVNIRNGLPDQEILPQTDVESEVEVGVEVTHDYPKNSGSGSGDVTRAITNPNATSARVKVQVGGLTLQEKDTGDLKGNEVAISILLNGVSVIEDTITGKTTSIYQRDYRFELQGDPPWNITVRRVTEDNDDAAINNDVYWSSYTEIIDAKMVYPDTAVVHIRGDAETFGNTVPSRKYMVYGTKCKIPSNYDTKTRSYSGIWDGTFKVAWTDNPAWVYYDLLTSKRYGVGAQVALPEDTKFDLYEIGRYCDQYVNDGFGNTEPRYTFNYYITSRDEALDVLRAVASVFRGFAFWGAGSVIVRSDMPRDPSRLVTNSNVEEGTFKYGSTSYSSRHSVAIVAWYDPSEMYAVSREVIEDPDLIEKYGWKPLEITAYGCTSRGQAHRLGKWQLITEQFENETVTYVAGVDHFDVIPGDIIEIEDTRYQNIRKGGRLRAIATNKVYLDAPVTLESGKTYYLHVTMPDLTIEERRVLTSSGLQQELTLSSSLSSMPLDNAEWILASLDKKPRQYRVLNKTEPEQGKYCITALLFNPDKFDEVEVPAPMPPVPVTPDLDLILPPANLSVVESLTWINGLPQSNLTISWTESRDPRVIGYNVQVLTPNGTRDDREYKKLCSFDLTNVSLGAYSFKVQCFAVNGQASSWITQTHEVVGKVIPPGMCTNLTATGWFGTVILNWINPSDTDIGYIEIWENAIDDRASAVMIAKATGTSYSRYLGSFIGMYYWVRPVDIAGNPGDFNAEAGTYGYAEQETHQDFVDYILEHNPYLQQAIDDLNTPIEAIEIDLAEIRDITIPEINTDIRDIKEVVIPEINTDIRDIKEVVIPEIDTKIADLEISLPDAIQKLSERIRGIDESVMGELAAVSASAVEALLNISETNGRITDAGILIDPKTGEVRIWAVDQLKQETDLRLVNAEMLISAQDAKIAQKVTLAEVDSRIAQAVFGDVGELLVSGLDARINTVEQNLDATNAELIQKATQVEVDALGGRVGDAEVRISGAEAAIELKATKIEVGEIGTRVTNAESSIDALNGQITQAVTAIGQDGKDLANLTAEGLVEAILNDADNHELAKVSLAMAKQELYANIEEGLEAEAGQRLQLAVVVDDNKSQILNEQIVRSTNDESLAQSISALSASTDAAIGSVNAAILDESEVRTNADEAITSQVSSLQSTVETNDSEVRGLIASESSTRATADSANATAIFTVAADLSGEISDREAAVTSEQSARVTADQALSSRIDTVQSVADGNTAVIQAETETRATADSAITEQINTLQSKVDDNEATIQTISGTVANESSALAQQTFTMISKSTDEVSEAVVEDILNQAEGREVAKKQYAVIRQEYNTKIEDGLLSEATKREALAAKLDQTEAVIQEDLRVLATKDEALAESVKTMGVKFGEDIEAAIQEERIVRVTAEEALAYEIETLQSRTGDNEAAIQDEVTARTTADEALAEEIHTVRSKTEDNEAAIQTVSKTFADESSATGSHVFTMVSRLTDQTAEGLVEDILNQAEGRETAKEQYAIIREEYDTKIEEGILSEATKRELLAVKLGEAEAAIQEEALARATQDGAIAETVKTMGVKFGEDIAAAIQEERRVTVEDDRALAESIDSLQSKLGDSFTAVETVEKAISEQGESLAKKITTLVASTMGGEVNKSATPPVDPAEGEIYFNTTTKKYYRWEDDIWWEMQGIIGDQLAIIEDADIASAERDRVLAESIKTLSTTVGNNTTKITQTASSVDGALGKVGVKIDSNGYITGWELIGGANSGAMVVHADVFAVGRPGATKRYPFMIGTVNGVQRISMDNAFIQDAAIVNAKIANLSVERIKIMGGKGRGLSYANAISGRLGGSRYSDSLYFGADPIGVGGRVVIIASATVFNNANSGTDAYLQYQSKDTGWNWNNLFHIGWWRMGSNLWTRSSNTASGWIEPKSDNTAYYFRIMLDAGYGSFTPELYSITAVGIYK